VATASTVKSSPNAHQALSDLPVTLREELLQAFDSIVRNFRERRWEPSTLNGGKLCEVVYTILRGYVDGSYPVHSSKPSNMLDACRSLEQASSSFSRSIRIQIPRMLIALYEIRNNRGVGHVGGEVDANHMDAVAVLYMAKWIVAELVRVFHRLDTATATEVVNLLVEREIPVIWHVGDKKRVLQHKLSMRDKMLLVLYTEPGTVSEQDVVSWLEYSNASGFRHNVVQPAHKDRFIEYDTIARTLQLSPLGVQYVEEKLPLILD
jgi:hypothetical protein